MKSGVRAQGSAVYDRGFAGVARGMDGGVSLQIQGLKPLAKITRSHWDRDRKRPKAAVVHKHLVLLKFDCEVRSKWTGCYMILL